MIIYLYLVVCLWNLGTLRERERERERDEIDVCVCVYVQVFVLKVTSWLIMIHE